MAASQQVSEYLYDLILDPTLLDLVLAMPDLTWREIATTAATLMIWDVISKPLASLAWRHARRPLSWGLFKLAVALRP
ncbi:hypothetical protein [Hyphomicrobium sp. LHD-15]|uniref:hypothetical protein n=1 Tax=Hyphomicrobium sp. LHD-15 TaxID=3072142 RepID=UPI00280C7CA9|nr:hypothetical protein [Hyphomicrobium sp. LHD-15]MDQ8697171.1 hypothetical protein [Hyphomicrobium sp. LHD-15]